MNKTQEHDDLVENFEDPNNFTLVDEDDLFVVPANSEIDDLEENLPEIEPPIDANLEELTGKTKKADQLAAVAEMFGRHFVRRYEHKNRFGNQTNYDPREDSAAWRGLYQDRFFVTYSIPRNAKKAVASFWCMKQHESGRFPASKHKVQIDLTAIVEALLKYHYSTELYSPIQNTNSDSQG